MNTEKLNYAMQYVDDDLLMEFFATDDRLTAESTKTRQRTLKRFAAAACIMLALLGGIAIGLERTHKGENIAEGEESLIEGDSQSNKPNPNPPDHNNTIRIGEQKDYSAIEGSDSLPDGYIFLRELTEKESSGTELAGCKLYVLATKTQDVYWDDFWLYQPTAKLTSLAYGKGQVPLYYHSDNCPEWIYTHWAPAPPPPEREERRGE